uniref:Uncharacterized protein n=1 Tax=Arundo donax TaxID=35708 RepID=A0A0A9BDA6_ARUDO
MYKSLCLHIKGKIKQEVL